MIRIGATATNIASTSERLYLTSSYPDTIVLNSSNSSGQLNIVFDGTSRFGCCNNVFSLTRGSERYASFSQSNIGFYDDMLSLSRSTSTIAAKGNIETTRTLVSKDLRTDDIVVGNNITATSNVLTNNLTTQTISYRGRNMIINQSISPPLITMDAAVNIVGDLILDKPLRLDNVEMANIFVSSNASFPSCQFNTSSSYYHTIDLKHRSGVNLHGCNLINTSIDNSNVLVLDTSGRIGVNTTAPANDTSVSLFASTRGAQNNVLGVFSSNGGRGLVVDSQGRIGIGTVPSYKTHIYDSNVTINPSEVVRVDVTGQVPAPIMGAYSNNVKVLDITSSGGVTIGNIPTDPTTMLNVGGLLQAPYITTSDILGSNNQINFHSTDCVNIRDINCQNAVLTGSLSAEDMFANVMSACNLVFPGVIIGEFTTQFDAGTVTFNSDTITMGGLNDNLLQEQGGRKVLITAPSVNGSTVVSLGVVGNDQGRNVIRIASSKPAFELFSSARPIWQKVAIGVDVTGMYMSYDTNNSAINLDTQRQIQISQFGVRISKSVQIPFADSRQSRAGFVGIGLESPVDSLPTLPQHRLHVQGGVWIQSSNVPTSSNTTPCFFVNDENGNVGIRTNNPIRACHVNGSLFATAVETQLPSVTVSDARVKSDLRVIEDPLTKINKLTGYTYLRRNAEQREAGLIAQDVLSVLPEAVKELGGDEGLYGISYDSLTGVFVEAIKALNAKIETLEAQLAALAPNK